MKLDATGAGLATFMRIAAVVAVSAGPEKGWLSPVTNGSGLLALVGLVAFIAVERTAQNPIVPLDLFFDRNRLGHLRHPLPRRRRALDADRAGHPLRTEHHGLQPPAHGYHLHPVRPRGGVGMGVSSRLVARFPLRVPQSSFTADIPDNVYDSTLLDLRYVMKTRNVDRTVGDVAGPSTSGPSRKRGDLR